MEEAKVKFRRKKILLSLIHILFLFLTVIGISAMYLNANYGKGIKWIYDEVYEDSESFCAQLEADIERMFTYVGYRDMFETNGKLDMHKPIVGVSDGPGMEEEYTLDQIVRYAKTRGYYLDENFRLQGVPMSMDDDDEEITVDYQKYNPSFINGDFMDTRMTKEDLALDILEHLGEYYTIYYNFIENKTNLRFRIVYKSDSGTEKVYTNVPDMTLADLRGAGKYIYIPGNTIRMDSNLSYVPVNVATLLEIWNPYENDQNYMVVSVDTSYPNVDAYSEEAAEFKDARNMFIFGMGGVICGVVGCLATLAMLMLLSGHVVEGSEEIRLYPIDEIYTELCLLIWAVAAAVLLYFGRYVGIRLLSLFLAEEEWTFWNKMVKLVILYGCVVMCGFDMLRRYKSRTLWRNSLAQKAIEASKDYVGRATFAAGSAFCYFLFLGGNAAMLWGLVLLFAYRGEKLSYRILFYAFICFFIGVDGLVFHRMFRKSVQRDLLDEAISSISQGNTSYRIDVDRLTGKERDMGEHINNISSGLGAALREQVKSERLKADLITNVSHDIKTPLTSIINYVDLIKREKIQDPKIAAYLEVLDQKSQRLKTLTEDLVEASKASSGNMKLEISDINFVELVHQTNGEFEERFAERRLELVSGFPEDGLIIRADGRRLWRVLENLYTNAFKYAMENSRVYVDVKEDDGHVEFTMKNVSEKPLNISPDELTERFVRGDVARTTEGSGLGLSIAQSLTQLQGGVFSISIDGDLFKASVIFPLERIEHRMEKLSSAVLYEDPKAEKEFEAEQEAEKETEKETEQESAQETELCPETEDEK